MNLLLLGEEEADVLFGAHDLDTLRKVQKENNYTMLALKRGARGSAVFTPDTVEEVDSFPVNSVDNIGAGDAFNAGFLYGYLEEYSPRQCGVLAMQWAHLPLWALATPKPCLMQHRCITLYSIAMKS